MGAAAHRHRGLALGRVDGELVGQVPVALLDAIGRLGVVADLLDGVVLAPPDVEVIPRYASCEGVKGPHRTTFGVARGYSEVRARTEELHRRQRSEEHTSELQSLMRISYAVFCLKNKKHITKHQQTLTTNR